MATVYDIEGELRINGEALGPWAAMGTKQSFGQIAEGGGFRRDWNGVAVAASRKSHRLYKSTISGADALPPVVQTLWRDDLATVECIFEECAGRGVVIPARFRRLFVPGSIRYVGLDGPLPEGFGDGNGGITGDPSRVLTTYYRPILDMIVREPVDGEHDYDAGAYTWSLQLEEVGTDA